MKSKKPSLLELGAKALATEIAAALFVNDATRLVTWDDNRKPPYQDRGGWCREAAIDQIAAVLIRNAKK